MTETHPRIVLLAAGQGSRMAPLGLDVPKSLLPVRAEPFAVRLLRQALDRGATDLTVVVGYRKDFVRATIEDGLGSTLAEHPDATLTFVDNDAYRDDVNIHSLTLGLGLDGEVPDPRPFIVVEADIFLTDAAWDVILDPADNGRSVWYTRGAFDPSQLGGILQSAPPADPEPGEPPHIHDLRIVPAWDASWAGYQKLVGVTRVGPGEVEAYTRWLVEYRDRNKKQYYLIPWIEHLDALACHDRDLGADNAISVNTPEEYLALVERIKGDAPEIVLVDPRKLRHIEDWDRERAAWLREKIETEGVWTRPLCVEREHLLVLDGQHRCEVGLALDLAAVPCILFDYDEVEVWSLRDDEAVTREIVTERALNGNIYPYKTAKHRFHTEIVMAEMPLDDLREPDGGAS